MRCRRILLTACLLALGLALSGCESFDPENALNFLNPKKPLPGERKAVFPEGVPGVPQGVPPELVQGYQPPPEPPPVVTEAPEKPKPAAKPKPRKVAAPAPPAGQAPGPSQRQTAPQPAQGQTPFPDPPPPGTFSR